MLAAFHLLAILGYLAAALLAAVPVARPVAAPARAVFATLGLAVGAHAAALVAFTLRSGQLPLTGLGPALSCVGFVLAASLLVVELAAREVSLTLVTAPLAALVTASAVLIGLTPGAAAPGMRGAWLYAHVVLSFAGLAAFSTAAAAGTMYLVQRRELRSRRFGAIFRLFPPLATLDRVNHVSAIVGWLGLTLGVVLATGYSLVYREVQTLEIVWATGVWIGITALAIGRVAGGWQARRAAVYSTIAFAAVLVLYVVLRAVGPGHAGFL